MEQLIRHYDWASTPAGPLDAWPPALRTALSICLDSSFPTAIYWGPDLCLLYNDAWTPIPGERHPGALGRPAAEVWADIWSVIGPQSAEVLRTGQGFSTFDQLLPMEREGRVSETYWNYSFTPIRGEDGTVLGIFNQGHETTDRVLGERHGRFLIELGDRLRRLSEPRAIIEAAQEALGRHLGANRVGYGEVEGTARYFTTESNWTDGGVPSRVGTHDLASFGPDVLASLRAGVPLLISDVSRDLRTSSPESLAAFDAIEVRAVITASLVKERRMRAALYVHAREPRPWTEREAELVTEVAERTWSAVEQARAEAEAHASQERLRDSEARFRALFEQAPLAIHIFDPSGRTLMVNPALTRTFGLPAAALDQYNIFDDPQMQDEEARDLLGRMFRGEVIRTPPVRHDASISAGEGRTRWVETLGFPVIDPAGALREVVLLTEDISDRVAAEETLRESEASFRTRLNAIPQMVWSTRPDGFHDFYNDRWYEFTGVRYGSTDGAGWNDMFHPEDQDRAWSAWRQSLVTGQPYEIEYRLRHRSGDYRWVLGRALPILDDQGEVIRWMGTCTDIDDLRRTTDELQRVSTLLQLIGNSSPDMIYAKDLDSRILHVNAAARKWVGLAPEEMVGRSDRDWASDPAQAEAIIANDRRVIETGETIDMDETFNDAGGRTGYFRSVKAPMRDGSGRIIGVVGVTSDMTARRRMEERLRELNETLEQQVAERTADRDRMWRLTTDIMLVARFDGTITAINPAWARLLGWSEEELLGRPFFDLVHPDDLDVTVAEASRLSEGITTFRFENRYRAQDGTYRWISWIAVPEDGLIHAVGRDVTADRARQAELEQAQEALRQAQKMEAMGQLTGGVAHDFNNLLTPIVATLDRLQRHGLGGERERKLIAGAALSADRAKTLVQRLLAFARRQPLQAIAVDVGALVRDMADLVASTIGPQFQVVTEVGSDLSPARGDRNQLEMALLNLAVNARDAMPAGGTLRISATAETVAPRHTTGLNPGSYIRLSVADTGTGMDEETLRRAVEPFFSTKGVGKGTGLGLSMAHGLATQLGGALLIHSKPGVGTNVELWLPQSSGSLIPAPLTDTAFAPKAGTVLLVDDDELARQSTSDILTELGYTVLEADSAESAGEMLRHRPDMDLVITDHLMPGSTGTDFARWVRVVWPDLPVLVISGYTERDGVEPNLPRLAKPFRKEELAASLVALSR
jgi:PAS domain S-box-containing protein